MTYGVNCAPYLTLRVLKELADSECHSMPTVQNALRLHTYVDDICVGADTGNELLQLRQDLTSVLNSAGFDLKKLSSNSAMFLNTIPPEDHVQVSLQFSDDDGGSIKVLGLRWNPADDVFEFDVQRSGDIFTKRSVLSTIARIYDPIGFLDPVIFYAKHVLQQVWKVTLEWDDPLPTDLMTTWRTFISDFHLLTNMKIPLHWL